MRTPVQQAEALREVPPVDANGHIDKSAVSHFANAVISGDAAAIVIIEPRALNRECLARCMGTMSGHNVLSFATVQDWIAARDSVSAAVVLVALSGAPREAKARQQLAQLLNSGEHLPIIVLSDVEDPEQIIETLHAGVRGYIPTSLPLDVAIESMRLVKAGGVFAPASSLISACFAKEHARPPKLLGNGIFTARQAAVVEALRRGKANKIIAHELNMSESTVKVHVRNIMKKLQARNRTEVAFMTNDLLKGDYM